MTTMAGRAESVIPAETDLDRAPGLLDGASSLELTPQACNLEYWLGAVAQGTLRGLVHGGHRAEAATPAWMREPGPLRQALIEEFAFRSIAEEKATRALSYLVLHAPDIDTMEFFATQLIDEARHSSVFRGHLLELGVAKDELGATIEQVAGESREKILVPLENFGLPLGRDAGDFIGGVCRPHRTCRRCPRCGLGAERAQVAPARSRSGRDRASGGHRRDPPPGGRQRDHSAIPAGEPL